jgi:putative phage-type endonuclease
MSKKAYTVPTLEGEAEWLAYRARCVTGSDVAAVFGEHPYKTRSKLLAEKLSHSPTTIPDNGAMWFGREMEDPNRKAFSKLTGIRTRGSHAFMVSKECPQLAVTIDGFALFPEKGITAKVPYWARDFFNGQFPVTAPGLGLIELKNSAKVPRTIPPHHAWQIQAQLAVTGLRWCVYVVKCGAAEFRVWYVPREEKTCKRIYDEVGSFYAELAEISKEFDNE